MSTHSPAATATSMDGSGGSASRTSMGDGSGGSGQHHQVINRRQDGLLRHPPSSGSQPIPVQELGGMFWAYLGPAPAPLLPRYAAFGL